MSYTPKFNKFAFWLHGNWHEEPMRVLSLLVAITPEEAVAKIKAQQPYSKPVVQPIFWDEQEEQQYLQMLKRSSNAAFQRGQQDAEL